MKNELESETIKKLRLLNITILPKNIGKLIFIFTEMIITSHLTQHSCLHTDKFLTKIHNVWTVMVILTAFAREKHTTIATCL